MQYISRSVAKERHIIVAAMNNAFGVYLCCFQSVGRCSISLDIIMALIITREREEQENPWRIRGYACSMGLLARGL